VAQAYASWASYGLPGLAGMGLKIVRVGHVPDDDGPLWIETRGKTSLIWSPLPHAEDWKDLTGGST